MDTQGLSHAVAATTAEVTDRNGALAAIDRCKPNLERAESVLVDGGYSGQPFADGVMERLKATVPVVQRNELHAFAVMPIGLVMIGRRPHRLQPRWFRAFLSTGSRSVVRARVRN